VQATGVRPLFLTDTSEDGLTARHVLASRPPPPSSPTGPRMDRPRIACSQATAASTVRQPPSAEPCTPTAASASAARRPPPPPCQCLDNRCSPSHVLRRGRGAWALLRHAPVPGFSGAHAGMAM
jgi:hypothetical protein